MHNDMCATHSHTMTLMLVMLVHTATHSHTLMLVMLVLVQRCWQCPCNCPKHGQSMVVCGLSVLCRWRELRSRLRIINTQTSNTDLPCEGSATATAAATQSGSVSARLQGLGDLREVRMCVCVHVCVRACVIREVRMCVCVCVCVCLCIPTIKSIMWRIAGVQAHVCCVYVCANHAHMWVVSQLQCFAQIPTMVPCVYVYVCVPCTCRWVVSRWLYSVSVTLTKQSHSQQTELQCAVWRGRAYTWRAWCTEPCG